MWLTIYSTPKQIVLKETGFGIGFGNALRGLLYNENTLFHINHRKIGLLMWQYEYINKTIRANK